MMTSLAETEEGGRRWFMTNASHPALLHDEEGWKNVSATQ